MTIPFWLSRSTRISTVMRSPSHSATRVAIEYGQLVAGDGEQLLAHELGHPLLLGHVAHRLDREVGRPLRQALHEVLDECRGRRPVRADTGK